MKVQRVDPRQDQRHKLDGTQGCAPWGGVAYYSIFSLGPITIIAMAVAGLFFGRTP